MAGDLDLLVGTWTVRVKSWVWEYDFRRDGGVVWRDLGSIESGVGNWAATSKLVNIWWKGSTTRESWQRPLTTGNDHTWYEASYYRGKYRIEKTGFVPPSPTPPSGSSDAAVIDKAWDASRSSLRFALNRLRLLQRQIKYFEDTDGRTPAYEELRRHYRRDLAVVKRKLLLPDGITDPAFRKALANLIRLFEMNLALPKSLNAARDGGKCAGSPQPWAAGADGPYPPEIDLCTIWFNADADLQRDVITRQYFRVIGVRDIGGGRGGHDGQGARQRQHAGADRRLPARSGQAEEFRWHRTYDPAAADTLTQRKPP